MLRNPSPRRGFSLIDLLVLVAILGFLIGFLLAVAIPKVRRAADSSQCLNNLKQIALAMHNCNDTYRKLPPTVGPFPLKDPATSNGTVHFYLLPFIEQAVLYNQAAEGNKYFVWHRDVWSVNVPTFLCPADPHPPKNHVYKDWLATTNYAANWQVFGWGGASIPRTFTPDGTSNTIVFAERYQQCNGDPCAWGYPEKYYWMPAFAYYSHAKFQSLPPPGECDSALAQGFHAGNIHVAMGDGSSRVVSRYITTYCIRERKGKEEKDLRQSLLIDPSPFHSLASAP